MEKIILGTTVSFELNTPNPEDGWIRENFDFSKKPACVTIGVSELIGEYVHPVSTVIFSLLRNRAADTELDYLQKLTINGSQCWCIDDGDAVTLLLPWEY